MALAKVVEFVDIEAPRSEVYAILVNLKRRIQLSPLWGVIQIDHISENFPCEGSEYQLSLIKPGHSPYNTIVTACIPLQKIAYRLEVHRNTQVVWTLQDIQSGTRVIYEEQFEVTDDEDEFVSQVRTVAHNWLQNIKRYAELRDGRLNKALRWLLDKYFLNLRKEQRNVVMIILFMQFTSIVTFIMVVVALGIGGILN